MDITPEEAEELARYTKGWVIAVYLQLCAWRGSATRAEAVSVMVNTMK